MKIFESVAYAGLWSEVVRLAAISFSRFVAVVHIAADFSKTVAAGTVVVHLAAKNRFVSRGVHYTRQ